MAHLIGTKLMEQDGDRIPVGSQMGETYVGGYRRLSRSGRPVPVRTRRRCKESWRVAETLTPSHAER